MTDQCAWGRSLGSTVTLVVVGIMQAAGLSDSIHAFIDIRTGLHMVTAMSFTTMLATTANQNDGPDMQGQEMCLLTDMQYSY